MRLADSGLQNTDSARLAEYGMIGAIAEWCSALHGKTPLARGLQLVGTGIDAEAVAIVRYTRSGGSDGRPLSWDRAPAQVRGGRVDRGYARSLLGSYFDAARPGTLWFRSMLDEVAQDLKDFQSARVMRELVVVPLEATDRFVDTVEIHFAEKLRSFQHHLLNSLAPVLSQTWKSRAPGLFTEAVLLRAEHKRDMISGGPVLSSENPARLSRAEYRVGLMLSRGMTVDEAKVTLNIRDSTLRTHLASLYAKTNAANLSELVFILVSAAPLEERRRAASVRLA
jgi:DNA-binding CsgD family transcriptional regulator